MLTTLGRLRRLIAEAIMPVKRPQTPSEKRAMLELIRWVSTRMEVPPEETRSALEKAQQLDSWEEAMDLLKTYYIMKGIRDRRAN